MTLLLAGVAAIGALPRSLAAVEKTKVDYNRDIRPIFSETCFKCHGFDEKSRKGKLRLDVADAAYAERDGTTPIKPGKPDASEAWRRIVATDEDELMPPAKSHLKLSDTDKAKVKAWIEQGAEYQKHWSFIAPVKAELPSISQPKWPKNEIDYFVLARLDAEGLKPSSEADRRTFIRRVTLDLTGLPPSSDEVEQFVNDKSGRAFETLVDRLLASPHFGERLAMEWLDAARYADTNGFSIDGGRHMWLWRDWVINAYNTNMPYDQFLREQLAGDLFPKPTQSQLIATGFERNNMVTHEGGTIPEENLTNYNADRVKTLGESILGLTVGCAQCHDHKYDPITQRDYYRLFAYFNTASDAGLDGNAGVNPNPSIKARTVLQTGEEQQIQVELKKLREKLDNIDADAFAQWEVQQHADLGERGKNLKLLPIQPLKVSTPNRGFGFEVEGSHILIKEPTDMVAYDVSTKLPETSAPITGLRIVFYPGKGAEGGLGYGPMERRATRKSAKGAKPAARKPLDDAEEEGAAPAPAKPAKMAAKPEKSDTAEKVKGNFNLTAFAASADQVPGDQINLNQLLAVDHVTANNWQAKFPPQDSLDPRNENGWSPEPEFDGPVYLTVTFTRPISAKQTPFLTTQLNFGSGGGMVAADFELMAMTGTDDGSTLPEEMISLLQADKAQRTSEQTQKLRAYFAANSPTTKSTRIAIANLEERLTVLTSEFTTMVMNVAPKPRDTFILHRGDYAQPTDKVTAGTPSALPPPADGAPANRLGLAQWVTMRSNPLTARVAVNRFWQTLFGMGIVKTSADFGSQGEWPSHPELLDWLAVDFEDGGWDVKALVKKMVLSATYRQTSAVDAALLDRDPQNRLLARGPRFRLSAETIRDSALKVSGLLVPRIGGPSVNPYTPGDLWREISHYGSTPATAQTFVQDHGEKLYRRSLYTYWKRTVPPPNMAAFDAPSREICTIARPSTNTPLQALVMLNDVQFVEANRAFAERIIARCNDDPERLRWAFAECLSRQPNDKEMGVLNNALQRERARYNANKAEAAAYLANGESPRNEHIAPAEQAAWAQVAALLLNLSEAVTRN